MTGTLAASIMQYAVYALEVYLVWYLFTRGQWKRLAGVLIYAVLFLLIDAVARPYFLYSYGFTSREYVYCYWSTDVLIEFAAFLLVCSFFKRALRDDRERWLLVRRVLGSAFVLVFAVSVFSIFRNSGHLIGAHFIIEFQQNLYFAVLVLNSMLYIMMQQLDSHDEELSMLVCGLGILTAGPAACFALVHLTPGLSSSRALLGVILQFGALGMLLTWIYAVGRMAQQRVTETSRIKQAVSAHEEQVVVSRA